MAGTRRVINSQQQPPKYNLAAILDEYLENKAYLGKYDKLVKQGNDIIKSEMKNRNLETFESAKCIATVSSREPEIFNEDKAIELLKANLTPEQLEQVIKSKEYIDADALEKIIYNKDFDAAILAPCYTKDAPIYTLRISKK